MRTISLRKFRDSIAAVDDSVHVTVRLSDGSYHLLGTWTPATLEEADIDLRATPNPGAASDRFNSRPFTPVPKRR